mmetsp:Transcript_66441/g.214737  ORF Transcript_66441/g.214737 Transcript_66441/m.214737 type:complete len:244 (-) Transcript_66441:1350-2081(-)
MLYAVHVEGRCHHDKRVAEHESASELATASSLLKMASGWAPEAHEGSSLDVGGRVEADLVQPPSAHGRQASAAEAPRRGAAPGAEADQREEHVLHDILGCHTHRALDEAAAPPIDNHTLHQDTLQPLRQRPQAQGPQRWLPLRHRGRPCRAPAEATAAAAAVACGRAADGAVGAEGGAAGGTGSAGGLRGEQPLRPSAIGHEQPAESELHHGLGKGQAADSVDLHAHERQLEEELRCPLAVLH